MTRRVAGFFMEKTVIDNDDKDDLEVEVGVDEDEEEVVQTDQLDDQTDDEDDGSDEEGDEESLSPSQLKRRRKRANRKRQREADEREIAELRRQNEELRRQGQELRDRVDRVEEVGKTERSEKQAADLDREIADARDVIRSAAEAGDWGAHSEATIRLQRAFARQQRIEEAGEAEKRQRKPAEVKVAPRENPVVRRWIKDNRDWFEQPGYEDETLAVREIDHRLTTQEGLSYEDPDYWDRVDAIMRKRHPKLYEEEPAREQPGRQIVTSGSGSRTRGRVTIPPALVKAAEEAGIDTSDPAEMKDLARRYQESQKRGAA